MKEHYLKLERVYLGANINKEFYPSTNVEIEDRKCTINLEVSPIYYHGLNAVHGSVYFKLLDDAAFFAAQSVIEEFFILTADFQIKLLRPIINGKITAIGLMQKNDGKNIFAKSELFDENDLLLAKGEGRFVVSKLKMTPEIGYK